MMQVSSMVRIPGRDEVLEAQFRQQQQMYGQQRPQASMMAGQYVAPANQNYGYAYQQRAAVATAPQSPPSPPGDDLNKPSLPSISSLLGMAEDTSNSTQQAVPEQQVATVMTTQSPQYQGEVMPASAAPVMSNTKMTLPPTPPLGPESIVDGHQSPSGVSTHSAVSAPTYYMNTSMNHMDMAQQHRHSYSGASGVSRGASMAVQPVVSTPYSAASYPNTPYHHPATALTSNTPYYSTDTPVLPSSGMYGQRQLPSNFPPPLHLPMGMGAPAPGPSPWQHHHYINHTSQSSFPQSQDRYICPTCNKAFSRPSSLRIHSHSHTGEKPFKCSHAGCGKAFSVRSNMKRHERGCHASSGAGMLSS